MGDLKGSMNGLFEKAVEKASNGKDDTLSFMLKLAAGRVKTCPFDEGSLAEARAAIRQRFGLDEKEDVVASGQVFHLRLIGRLLKAYGDPDWEFVDNMGEGIPLGLTSNCPGPQRSLKKRANGSCQTMPAQGWTRARITARSTRTWRR
jgi:hypothetical protein